MTTHLDASSEQNILNMLMENSVISTDQMSKINSTSGEIGKSKLETAFELNIANEDKILKICFLKLFLLNMYKLHSQYNNQYKKKYKNKYKNTNKKK